MDVAKRNALIASLLAPGSTPGRKDLLTDDDRAAIAAARADELSLQPGEYSPVVTIPDDEEQDIVIQLELLLQWQDRFLAPRSYLNVGLLEDSPESFVGLSPAEVFEQLILRERQRKARPTPTIDIHAFLDGNTDRASIAPNIVDSTAGPTFEILRDTLLALADRTDVAAVGVEIHELPNPENPADDDIWLAADRVFIWTRQPLRTVKEWVAPLHADSVARMSLKSVAAPVALPVQRGTRVYALTWD